MNMTRKTTLKGILAAFGITAMAITLVPDTASAGIFRALFGNGGGGGWSNVSGRHSTSFPSNFAPGQIIISFSDRRLYHITSRGRADSYPIGVPAGNARWQGTLRVSRKAVNPRWTPTPSMRRENPKLPVSVPGGHPRNPMGVRALYLGSTLYRIHGTDAPWTVGKDVTHGCIRLYNKDVINLYNKVRIGTKVTVTYRRFK